MIGIKIYKEKKVIDISLSNLKFLVGNNYVEKDLIVKAINNCFNKEKDSEYAIEENKIAKVIINENDIRINDYDFFYINKYIDLNCELKMGPKSLIMKYYEGLIYDLEYSDEYQTCQIAIDTLLDLLDERINEELSNIKINVVNQFNKKLLLKLFSLELLKESFIANNNDLNTEESIMLQLEMVKKISEKNGKKTIIILEIDYLTKKEEEFIRSFSSNVYLLAVIKEKGKEFHNYEEIVIMDEKYSFLDLADDNCIYELTMAGNSINNIAQTRLLLLDYLNNKFII